MSSTSVVSRRTFLKTGAVAGGALVIGFQLPLFRRNAAAGHPGEPFAPNAWIRVGADDTVTILVDRSEMGQGVSTSLPMLVAEELDADWEHVRMEFAPAAPPYANPLFGVQGTGGSTSVNAGWEPLRKAGAAARAMLVAAAAAEWAVDPSQCRTEKGTVIHAASGRRLRYGELVGKAAALPVPQDVALKDPKDFRLLGTRVPRLDTPDKVTGKAVFGIDVKAPGLLVASVERCPVFGGKLASFDGAAAQAVPGVRHVVQIDSGVAVVANGYWPALQGRRALKVQWDEGARAGQTSAEIRERFAKRADGPAPAARKDGDAGAALASAARRVEAVYELPYLAHATMEPMNATAHVRTDGCDVWAPTQFQTGIQIVGAAITGLAREAIQVHTTYLGGGFGRRFELDFVSEALQVSKAVSAPVKVVWSREDDIRHDYYRPAMYNRLVAALDPEGWPVAWSHRLVGPSIMSRPEIVALFGPVKDELDGSAVEGAAELAYAIPNVLVEYAREEPGVPVGFWRSVGNSHTAFVVESFIDELAAAGGKDPVEFRRRLLQKASRHLGVLELAAKKAGWGAPLPAARARGVAVHSSFRSFVAQVAEVSLDDDGLPRVHRVVCAVDCGPIVNPDTVEAQMESAIVYGLSAALYGTITIEDGRVKESNFHDYPVLRMNQMPVVEVHIVQSTESQGGVGEPATPPIAPAVANALFALTGRRVRTLPIGKA